MEENQSEELKSMPRVTAPRSLRKGRNMIAVASGKGGDSNHYLYGFLNLLTWPISVVWGIPEAAVDANRINERELIYYYTFNPAGQEALRAKGYEITASGRLAAVPATGKNR